jgi:hypothetical protein
MCKTRQQNNRKAKDEVCGKVGAAPEVRLPMDQSRSAIPAESSRAPPGADPRLAGDVGHSPSPQAGSAPPAGRPHLDLSYAWSECWVGAVIRNHFDQ